MSSAQTYTFSKTDCAYWLLPGNMLVWVMILPFAIVSGFRSRKSGKGLGFAGDIHANQI